MRRKKWWSNREREAGHEWVPEGLAADAGRREGPVLVSISPTWLLLPPPALRIRRLLQAKGKISTDLSGLESLALPQGWKTQWENVWGSPDPGLGARVGSWRGRWDVWCSWATALSENCSAGCPGAMGLGEKAGGGKDEHVHELRNTLGLDLAWVSFRYWVCLICQSWSCNWAVQGFGRI